MKFLAIATALFATIGFVTATESVEKRDDQE